MKVFRWILPYYNNLGCNAHKHPRNLGTHLSSSTASPSRIRAPKIISNLTIQLSYRCPLRLLFNIQFDIRGEDSRYRGRVFQACKLQGGKPLETWSGNKLFTENPPNSNIYLTRNLLCNLMATKQIFFSHSTRESQ